MSEHVGEVSDNSFEADVLKSGVPVIVDFWAPWCAPCKAIAPVLDELASEYKGKIKILKMNVENNPRTPANFSVRGIPNLIFFKGGEVVDQIVGSVPKDNIAAAIKKVVS